jgi:hypothetical protein
LIAQPKGYAAFLLFPHLKMIPLPVVLNEDEAKLFWKYMEYVAEKPV